MLFALLAKSPSMVWVPSLGQGGQGTPRALVIHGLGSRV